MITARRVMTLDELIDYLGQVRDDLGDAVVVLTAEDMPEEPRGPWVCLEQIPDLANEDQYPV